MSTRANNTDITVFLVIYLNVLAETDTDGFQIGQSSHALFLKVLLQKYIVTKITAESVVVRNSPNVFNYVIKFVANIEMKLELKQNDCFYGLSGEGELSASWERALFMLLWT